MRLITSVLNQDMSACLAFEKKKNSHRNDANSVRINYHYTAGFSQILQNLSLKLFVFFFSASLTENDTIMPFDSGGISVLTASVSVGCKLLGIK